MARFIKGIGSFIKKRIRYLIDSILYFLPIYHRKLNRISLTKWFEVLHGNIAKLNRFNIGYKPKFLIKIYSDLVFQMPYLNLDTLRLRADAAIYASMAARLNDKGLKFESDSILARLEKESKDNDNENDDPNANLNKFVDYIELTFNYLGMIDPDKTSAMRGYSLFYKAKEHNERLKKKLNVYNSK